MAMDEFFIHSANQSLWNAYFKYTLHLFIHNQARSVQMNLANNINHVATLFEIHSSFLHKQPPLCQALC